MTPAGGKPRRSWQRKARNMEYPKFSDLIGKTFTSFDINSDNDVIEIVCESGERFRLYHHQDCCETVLINDIVGDVADLIGTPILAAEAAESDKRPDGVPLRDGSYEDESNTWTFYKLRTIKGSVDIRWHGSSNGYYSESVTFAKIET